MFPKLYNSIKNYFLSSSFLETGREYHGLEKAPQILSYIKVSWVIFRKSGLLGPVPRDLVSEVLKLGTFTGSSTDISDTGEMSFFYLLCQ